MITVINLKIGNIASVSRALKYLGVEHIVTNCPEEIASAEKIVFPGVGNFSEASVRISALGLDTILRKKVLKEKTPILGICLGMQLFATYGEEGGMAKGLDFIKAKVTRHRAANYNLRLPHIGWNEVNFSNMKIFNSVANNACFYFVHSYEFVPQESVEAAYSNYGIDFVAMVKKDNIIGVQFHPEKSQAAGLRLLKNFCEGIF